MSERKVLNKYYPPDFDPNKIPKLKQKRNHTFDIRLMAPFNMRCNTCGEYIYKGKKFNSRKETVDNENYLGLYIYRFYIKCPQCVAEIAFKTDPQTTDYILEAGATRNFEALRTAELQAIHEDKLKKAEEANNPMKLLENRTKASQNEMNLLETLEDLKQINSMHNSVNTDEIIKQQYEDYETIKKRKENEDEEEIKNIYRNHIKRLPTSSKEDIPTKINSSNQTKNDLFWMKKALQLAETALIKGEVPVGCLFVYKDEVIAAGTNTSNEVKTGIHHAEMNAIDQLLDWCSTRNERRDSVIENGIFYVTVEPCIMCAASLRIIGSRNVVFGCRNERFGGCESTFDIHHRIDTFNRPFEFKSGICADESIALLKRFYNGQNPNSLRE